MGTSRSHLGGQLLRSIGTLGRLERPCGYHRCGTMVIFEMPVIGGDPPQGRPPQYCGTPCRRKAEQRRDLLRGLIPRLQAKLDDPGLDPEEREWVERLLAGIHWEMSPIDTA